MTKTATNLLFATLALAGLAVAGCNSSPSTPGTDAASNGATTAKLTGSVSMDGSSTVGPIMEAVSEEFGRENPGVKPTVGISGSGGGFKKFAAAEIDIVNASRPIEEKEIEACKAKGVEFIELPIAFDGLSLVVNPQNTFLDDITVAELKKIWEPNSAVHTWDQVRAGFPKEPIKLYGAGTDSGTFDYFTKAIVGEEKSSRSDYQASEDDNTLVQGVAGDKYSLGYFGYAYYDQNKDKLKLLKINGIAPSPETIGDGTYQPLSRPLFVYVNKKSLDTNPAVKAILDYLLTKGPELISGVGYVPLAEGDYAAVRERLAKKTLGTAFKGAETGIKIKDILSRENAPQ